MKFYFAKTESLYKIFKTLERIPPQKAAEIFIDPEHSFFENQRWGKEALNIIKNRNLNITFLAEKPSSRIYFQQIGAQVQYKEERLILKVLKTISLFLFDIKKFHLHTYNKQKYLFYMVFFFEILAGLGIVWLLFLLILPSASITLKVSQQTENIIYNFRYYPASDQQYLGAIKQLSIPYYTGKVDYEYTLSISTENIKHIINPSAGNVKIYNKTPNELKLVSNTRFVTADGLTFLTREPIVIPPAINGSTSELKVKLYAAEYDESENIIWVRGNIPAKTQLTIRNVKDSYYLKQIWAEAIENFTGGAMKSLGMVSEKDRELLAKKIKDAVYKDKLNIVTREFSQKNAMVLLFDPLIKTKFNALSIDWNIWDKTTSLRGMAQVSFDFLYLKWDDVVSAFSTYVKQRQSDSIQLISLDPNTFWFVGDLGRVIQNKVFMLPTKITILQGYDFSRDTKGILGQIKTNIVGKSIEETRKEILTYPEVSSVKIDLWLLWGQTLPDIRSRIKLNVEL